MCNQYHFALELLGALVSALWCILGSDPGLRKKSDNKPLRFYLCRIGKLYKCEHGLFQYWRIGWFRRTQLESCI